MSTHLVSNTGDELVLLELEHAGAQFNFADSVQ